MSFFRAKLYLVTYYYFFCLISTILEHDDFQYSFILKCTVFFVNLYMHCYLQCVFEKHFNVVSYYIQFFNLKSYRSCLSQKCYLQYALHVCTGIYIYLNTNTIIIRFQGLKKNSFAYNAYLPVLFLRAKQFNISKNCTEKYQYSLVKVF